MYREVTDMPKCANCGILVPTAEVRFEHHGAQLYACSARCIEVYDRYKFPRYESEIRELEREGRPGLMHGYVSEG